VQGSDRGLLLDIVGRIVKRIRNNSVRRVDVSAEVRTGRLLNIVPALSLEPTSSVFFRNVYLYIY
jgi:hypothetical protein